MPLPIIIAATICALCLIALAWMRVTTPPPAHKRQRDPYHMQPMARTTDIEPATPRHIEPQPPRAPAPESEGIERYRRRVVDLERELAAANNLVEQLAKQLKANGPTDMIVIYLDVHGIPVSTRKIGRALDLDPAEARRRLIRLDSVIEVDHDQWQLVGAA